MKRLIVTRSPAKSLLRSRNTSTSRTTCIAIRPFSNSLGQRENSTRDQIKSKTDSLLQSIYGSTQATSHAVSQSNAMESLSQSMIFPTSNKSNVDTSALLGKSPSEVSLKKDDDLEPYHFHIYSHKHNTHITCSKPNREPIISMSCGNIGYKKSRRGTFDSAYSLTKYVLERLIHTGWPMKMRRLELVLRGFGQGREAAVKVLMSPEGKVLRDKIVRVADSTKIKFAGTRSEKPRRL